MDFTIKKNRLTTKLIMKIRTEQTEHSLHSHRIRVFDVAELSKHDGPGVRTVVYFQGCSAQCEWCHSPHSQTYKAPLMFISSLCLNCGRCAKVCQQKVHEFGEAGHILHRERCTSCGACIEECPTSTSGIKGSALHLPTTETTVSSLWTQIFPYLRLTRKEGGITLSGGEALLQLEAAEELLQLCKQEGIHTAIETSGLLPLGIYKKVAPLVDLWLFGMRVITGNKHKRHDEEICMALNYLVNKGANILPQIPMIPGYFDRDDILQSITSILIKNKIKTVSILPWNRDFDLNYRYADISLKMDAPSTHEIEYCESKIISFFTHLNFNIYERESMEFKSGKPDE